MFNCSELPSWVEEKRKQNWDLEMKIKEYKEDFIIKMDFSDGIAVPIYDVNNPKVQLLDKVSDMISRDEQEMMWVATGHDLNELKRYRVISAKINKTQGEKHG